MIQLSQRASAKRTHSAAAYLMDLIHLIIQSPIPPIHTFLHVLSFSKN